MWKGDGVIGPFSQKWEVEAVKGIPTVNVAGSTKNIPLPRVIPDNFEAGRLAAEHFLQRGYSRFGCLSTLGTWSSELRRDGFAYTLKNSGSQVGDIEDLCMTYEEAYREESFWQYNQKQIHDWIIKLPRPIALFGTNDEWARRIAHACIQANIRVPEDIAILGAQNEQVICEGLATRPYPA